MSKNERPSTHGRVGRETGPRSECISAWRCALGDQANDDHDGTTLALTGASSARATEAHQALLPLYAKPGVISVAPISASDKLRKPVIDGVFNAVAKRKLEVVGAASYERNTENVKSAVEKIKAANPDVVLVSAVAKTGERIQRRWPATHRLVWSRSSYTTSDHQALSETFISTTAGDGLEPVTRLKVK